MSLLVPSFIDPRVDSRAISFETQQEHAVEAAPRTEERAAPWLLVIHTGGGARQHATSGRR